MDEDVDDVGLRTSRMFNFCGMCLFEFFFLRHTVVDEKDRRTILVRREYDVAKILGKFGGFYTFLVVAGLCKKSDQRDSN